MKIRELYYLIVYSIVSFISDILEIFSLIRKPQTWSYIVFFSIIIAGYYQKYKVVPYLIVSMFLIKIIRDKKEGAYRKYIFDHDIKNDIDSTLVKESYRKYKQKEEIIKKIPLSFEDWKAKQKEKYIA